MKQFYTKENEEVAKQIREALIADKKVRVHNQYETFYGVGFDGWLKKQLEDLNVKYEVIDYNQHEGYPWTYEITLVEGEKQPVVKRTGKVLRIFTRASDWKLGQYVQKRKDIELTEAEALVLEDILNKIGHNKVSVSGFGAKDQENLSYMATPLVQTIGKGEDKRNRFEIESAVYVYDLAEED